MEIDVFVGSITDPTIGAHAIVNAANPHVALGSGVSGAIRAACGGTAFQVEVRARLEEDFGDPLEPGDCLVTGAGAATAFRWVLHVPSVDYQRPDPQTGLPTSPERVARCAESVVREGARLAREHALNGGFVAAVPVLGAGHGGLGVVAGLDALMEGVRRGLAEDSGARDAIALLVVVALDEPTARLVRFAAEKHSLVTRRPPSAP